VHIVTQTIRASYDSRHPEEGMRIENAAGEYLATVPIPLPIQPGETLGVVVRGAWWAARDNANPIPLTQSQLENR